MRRSPHARQALAALALAAGCAGAALAAPAHAPVRAPSAAAPRHAPRTLVFDFESPADTNAKWPEGWRRGGNVPAATVRLDAAAHGGTRAARLEMPEGKGFVAIARELPDSLRAGIVRVRLSGWLRTDRAGSASLWIRVAGPAGQEIVDDESGRAAHGTTPWTRWEVSLPVPADANVVSFGALVRGGGTLHVDDVALELLGRDDLPPPSPAALAYATQALDTLERHSILADQLDWSLLRRRTLDQLRGARTPPETYPALRYAARRVDPNGDFVTPRERRTRDSLELAAPPRFEDQPTSNRFTYYIARVQVPSFAGHTPQRASAFAGALQTTLGLLDSAGTRGYIVDLRFAGGRDPGPALAGLGPLLGGAPFGYFAPPHDPRGAWRYRDGEFTATAGRRVVARTRASEVARFTHPDAPVAVLVGNRTSAAGEAVAVAFLGRPSTRIFGEHTAGNGIVSQVYRLSDGAELVVSTSRLADRSGKVLAGPLAPDTTLIDQPAGFDAHDPAIHAALDWLTTQPGCTYQPPARK